jgi:hypothetical protein
MSELGFVANRPNSQFWSDLKILYNMFESSYLEKQNENDMYVHLTFNYNKVIKNKNIKIEKEQI